MEGEVKGKTFKMKGHTLPGINQRSEGNTDLADGRSKSSTFQTNGMMGTFPGGTGNIAQAVQDPLIPGVGIMPGPPFKPSIAKDKAYTNPGLPENKAHNAKAATEQHYGYPHGPKPAAPKSKPSMAKDKRVYFHAPKKAAAHNAKAATEDHFGDPHGPKPSLAKDMISGKYTQKFEK